MDGIRMIDSEGNTHISMTQKTPRVVVHRSLTGDLFVNLETQKDEHHMYSNFGTGQEDLRTKSIPHQSSVTDTHPLSCTSVRW